MEEKKELKVAIVGVPMFEVLERSDFIRRLPVFVPGATKGITKKIGEHLKKDIKKLGKRGINVKIKQIEYNAEGKTISELGKDVPLTHQTRWVDLKNKDKFVVATEANMKKLAQKMKKELKNHDLVLGFGLGHHGAYPFYALDGKVVRIDRHTDRFIRDTKRDSESILNDNYVAFALKHKLKEANDIQNVGIEKWVNKETKDQKTTHTVKKADILDIDIDTFHRKYGKLTAYQQEEKGIMPAPEIGKAIQKTSPKAVLFFEYYPKGPFDNKAAERLMKALSSHSLRVAAEKKYPRKNLGKNS